MQRLAHDELPPAEAEAVRSHVAVCAACRARVEAVQMEDERVARLLATLDHAPPAIDAAHVIARARLQDPTAPGSRPASPRTWLRRAALIALTAGAAGAAWALPGSPVHGWMDRLLGTGADAPVQRVPGEPQAEAAGGGVAIAPGLALTIQFTRAHRAARLHVSLIDGAEVEVEAIGGGVLFTDDPDDQRLVIDNAASDASFDVRIPRAAARVEIRVGEHTLFLKEGRRLITEVEPDSAGVWVLPLAAAAGAGRSGAP